MNSNSKQNLGNLNSAQEFKTKLVSFAEKLKDQKKYKSDAAAKIKALTELNNKVSNSYNVSLEIIVDVTRLLNQYMVYFNQIDALMGELNATKNSNSLSNKYFENINLLTSKKIEELSANFKNSLTDLKIVYDKHKLDSSNLDKYNNLLDSINSESKLLLKTQSGGKHKK